jgi:hypothetical protein
MTTTVSQPVAPYSDDNGTLNTGGISDRRIQIRGGGSVGGSTTQAHMNGSGVGAGLSR